jgi:hypothetical protein
MPLLGKILYEVLAGVPLPAFVSPTDPEYDLSRKWDGPAYRAVNRVIRGLLHDDPTVRLTYLGELPGQIDELLSLQATRELAPITMPRWHTDLLSASDLLASSASASAAKKPEDAMKEEADQIAMEDLEVWQSSEAVKQLDEALGTHVVGVLLLPVPRSATLSARSLVACNRLDRALNRSRMRAIRFALRRNRERI